MIAAYNDHFNELLSQLHEQERRLGSVMDHFEHCENAHIVRGKAIEGRCSRSHSELYAVDLWLTLRKRSHLLQSL